MRRPWAYLLAGFLLTSPGYPAVKEKLRDFSQKLKASQERYKAGELADQEKFCQAFEHYQNALEIWPKYAEKSRFRADWVETGLSCAVQLMQEKEWEDAIGVLKRTEKFGKVDEAEKNLRYAEEQLGKAKRLYQQGKSYLEMREWGKAREAFGRAEDIYPRLDAAELLEKIKPVAVQDLLRRADSSLKRGLYDKAEELYEEVLEWDRECEEAEAGLKRTWLAKGKSFEVRGLYGLSLVHYLKAGDRQAVERVRKKLARSLGFSVDFQISGKDGYRIEKALEGLAGRWAYAGPGGIVKLSGKVERVEVERSSQTWQRQKKYIKYYRTERNPEYDELRAEIEECWREVRAEEADIQRRKSGLTGATGGISGIMESAESASISMAEATLATKKFQCKTLETQLNMTPLTIKVPVYDWWNYVEEIVTKTAKISLKLQGKSYTITESASDRTIHNPKPGVVDPDPLELPSDSEVIGRAVRKFAERFVPNYLRKLAGKLKPRASGCEGEIESAFLGKGQPSCLPEKDRKLLERYFDEVRF